MNKYYKSYRYITNSKVNIPKPFSYQVKADFGVKLKEFIKDKFGTAKKFCRLYGFSESLISKIIKGERKITPELKQILIRKGFDEALIYNYIITDEPSEIDRKTKSVIFELKRIIDYQNTLIVNYEKAIIELRKDYDELRKLTKKEIDSN